MRLYVCPASRGIRLAFISKRTRIIMYTKIDRTAEKKLFLTSFTLSLIVHIVIILLLSLSYSKKSIFRKPLKSIEVTYRDLKPQKKKERNETNNKKKI